MLRPYLHVAAAMTHETMLLRLIALALFLAALPVQAQVLPSFGQERTGGSGLQFLKVPVDARGAALSGTMAAIADDASALYWNPALAAANGTQVGLATTSYVADIALYYTAAYTPVSTPLGRFTLGVSVQALDSGEMDVTTEFSGPAGTGETFKLVDLAFGLTVAQALTDLFSYGITGKLVRESAAEVATTAGLLDLGVAYRVGDTGVRFGVSIRNFGFEVSPGGSVTRETLGGEIIEERFDGIEPPTTFLLGVSYRPLRTLGFNSGGPHDLTFSGQLTNPNDNAERFNLGAEYVWNETLVLRTGYEFGIEEATVPSFGLGLAVPGLGPDLRVDYGFNRLDRLGNIHRIGLNLRLNG
ncbi:MAG: PorV/PorQ family protein [Bacteroidota bacterium]